MSKPPRLGAGLPERNDVDAHRVGRVKPGLAELPGQIDHRSPSSTLLHEFDRHRACNSDLPHESGCLAPNHFDPSKYLDDAGNGFRAGQLGFQSADQSHDPLVPFKRFSDLRQPQLLCERERVLSRKLIVQRTMHGQYADNRRPVRWPETECSVDEKGIQLIHPDVRRRSDVQLQAEPPNLMIRAHPHTRRIPLRMVSLPMDDGCEIVGDFVDGGHSAGSLMEVTHS